MNTIKELGERRESLRRKVKGTEFGEGERHDT